MRKLPTHLKRLHYLVEELTRKATNEKRLDFGIWTVCVHFSSVESNLNSLWFTMFARVSGTINATVLQEYTGSSCERKCRETTKRGCPGSKSGEKCNKLTYGCLKFQKKSPMLGFFLYILFVSSMGMENLTFLVKFGCFIVVSGSLCAFVHHQ